jgi:uncharacterized protein DUF3467
VERQEERPVETKGEPPIQLRVRFVNDPSVRTAYATNMMVQSTDQEFIVIFFEARPPYITGDTVDERRAAAAKIENTIDALEVARVVIAPDRLETFINLLQQQVERRSKTVFEGAPTTKERSR